MQQESLQLWDEEMPIQSTTEFQVAGSRFSFQEVQASDNTHGLLEIYTDKIESPIKNLEAYLFARLQNLGLQPDCRTVGVHRFLVAIEPITAQLREFFEDEHMGIVILINGNEPGNGTLPFNEMTMDAGDTVQIYYRMTTAMKQQTRDLLCMTTAQ